MANQIAVTEIGINAMGSASANPTVAVPAGGVPRGALAIIAFVVDTLVTETGITDSKGNTWKQLGTASFNTNAQKVRVWTSYITSALVSGDTLTVNIASVQAQIQAFYISGQAWGEYATAKDLTETVKGNAATATALTAAPLGQSNMADAIAIGFFGVGSGTTTVAPTSPWVQTGLTGKVASGSFTLAIAYQIVSARANYSPAITLGTSSVYGAISAIIRASLARMISTPNRTAAALAAAAR